MKTLWETGLCKRRLPLLGRRNVVNVQEWLSLQEKRFQIRKVSSSRRLLTKGKVDQVDAAALLYRKRVH